MDDQSADVVARDVAIRYCTEKIAAPSETEIRSDFLIPPDVQQHGWFESEKGIKLRFLGPIAPN